MPPPLVRTVAPLGIALAAAVLASCQPSPGVAPGRAPAAAAEPTPLPVPSSQPPPALEGSPPASAPTLPASLRDSEWTRLPTSGPIVALTFDAGAGAQGIASILATLKQKAVPATFFLSGRWVESYPAQARAIAAIPATTIANHTWSHPRLPDLADAAVDEEVTRAESMILAITGRQPRPLFRFPYGASDARTLADIRALGYGSIRWTVDTQGWRGVSGGQSADLVLNRVIDRLEPGEIVLMHVGAADDGSTLDAEALPRVIDVIRGRGYGFVAIWDFIYGHA